MAFNNDDEYDPNIPCFYGFDLNNDGKRDWKDYVDAYNIQQMASETDDEYSCFGYGSSSFDGTISPLGIIVILVTFVLCLIFLFSGCIEGIGTLLGFGVIAFAIAQWLCS